MEFINEYHASYWILAFNSSFSLLTFFILFSLNIGEFFSFEKFFKIFFQIFSSCWMTLVNNFSSSINEHDIWYTSHFIDFTAIGFGSMVMDWPIPVLCFNMLHNSVSSLIDTNTDDLDLVTPFGTIIGKHFFVVSHWFLTWWAPGGPEINEPNFSWDVLEGNWITTFNWDDSRDWLVLAALLNDARDVKRYFSDSLNDFLSIFLECRDCILAICREIFLDLEYLFVFSR